MKKRIISYLLTVAMLICLLPMSVSAATELTYAKVASGVGTWQKETNPSNSSTTYAFTIANEGHESERSWHITYVPAEGETSGVGMRLQLPTGTYEMNGNTTVVSGAKIQTVGKYKLSFWVKIVKGSDGIIYGPAWNWQGQNIFDAPHKVTANSEWQKVEATGNFTGSGANQNMKFSIKGATEKDFYIDDIALVRIADDGTEISPNLLTPELGTFEVEDCVRDEATENGGINTDGTEWAFSKSTTGASKWGAHVSTADAKDSTASMRLRWHPDIATVNNDNVSYRLQLPDMESGKLDTMGTYTLSFWCKRVKGTSLKFVGPWDWTPLNIADYVPTIGEWTKVEITKDLTTLDNGSATKNLQFVLQGKDDTEVFIDKISIKDADGNEYVGTSQGEFEEITTPSVPSIEYPDLTGTYFKSDEYQVQGNLPQSANTNWKTEITAADAHESSRSLHLLYEPADDETGNISYRLQLKDLDYTDETSGIRTIVSGAKVQEEGWYRLTFWIKLVKGGTINSCGFTPPWSTSGHLFKDNGITTYGEWTKHVYEGEYKSGSGCQNMYLTVKEKVDSEYYIDNIAIERIDAKGGNVVSPNLISAAGSTFETVTEGTEAFGATVIDENLEVIDALTTDLSGKPVYAFAQVVNHKEAPVTGQLLFCLYDGYMLKEAKLSEVITVEAGKPAVNVTAEMFMPEFTEVGELNFKVFLWDSVAGMTPLTENVFEMP